MIFYTSGFSWESSWNLSALKLISVLYTEFMTFDFFCTFIEINGLEIEFMTSETFFLYLKK